MNQYTLEASVSKSDQSWTVARGALVFLLLVITGCGEAFDQLDESAGKGAAVSAGRVTALPPPSPPLPPSPEQVDQAAVKVVLKDMRAISVALRKYQEQQGSLPAASTFDAAGQPLLSWRVALLPFLGEEELYQQFHHDEPWDSQHNLALAEKIPKIYESPLRKKSSKTNYLVPVGRLTLFGQKKGIALVDVDGQIGSATLVVEVDNARAVIWTQPDDLRIDAEDPEANIGNAHAKGFYMIFADFRVVFLTSDVDLETLESHLSLKEGQITIPEPEKQYSPSLLGESEKAFEAGRGGDAIRLLKGAALVGLSGVDLTRTMRWSPALRRPTMAARWAVGWQTFGKKKTSETASGSVGALVQSFQSHTFEIGKNLIEDLSDRCDRGFFGAALNKQVGKEEERPRISGASLSGVSVLGEGDLKQLQEMAVKDDCDFLLFAETKYRNSGKAASDSDKKKVVSTLTVKIIQVTTGDELWVSKPITTGHIERIKKTPSDGPDPLKEMVQQFTDFINQNLALTDLPTLSTEQVKRRIVSLISPVPSDPLDVLTEIKLYESLNLLSTDEVTKVYQRVLGESKGAQLATGTAQEREKAIEQWLP